MQLNSCVLNTHLLPQIPELLCILWDKFSRRLAAQTASFFVDRKNKTKETKTTTTRAPECLAFARVGLRNCLQQLKIKLTRASGEFVKSALLCCHGFPWSLVGITTDCPQDRSPFSPTCCGCDQGQQLFLGLELVVLLVIRAIKRNPDKEAKRKKKEQQVPAVLTEKKTF